MTDIDSIEPIEPRAGACEHCGGGPDTVLVRRRITTYEYHRPNCPVINDEKGR